MRAWYVAVIFFALVHAASGQSKQLTAKQLNKYLPQRFDGYFTKTSKAKDILLGTLSYTIAERELSNRKRAVKILLFDYFNAPIMFSQSRSKWANLQSDQSDSSAFRKMKIASGESWISTHANTAQIIVAMFDRYILTIDGEHVTESELKAILEKINLTVLPR